MSASRTCSCEPVHTGARRQLRLVDVERPAAVKRLSCSARAFSYHAVGMKWKGSPVNTHPTFAELRTAANWEKVYSDKAIGVAAFQFNFLS